MTIVRSPIRSPIRSVIRSVIRGKFTPLSLFANGEQGAWYDPSDLSTLFQDAAMSTPVTSDGDPVGAIKDKSGNNNHATQSVAAKRPTFKISAGLRFLQFDGMDDGLATASIDFTATDKASIFTGMRKTSDASAGTLCELSASVSNPGTFLLRAPRSAADNYGFQLTGDTGTSDKFTTAGFSAPITNVVTGILDIAEVAATDEIVIRVDGAVAATNTPGTAAGGGNFSDNVLNIGARAGSSIFLDGNIFGFVVRGVLSTTEEIDKTESFLAGKSGVTLP